MKDLDKIIKQLATLQRAENQAQRLRVSTLIDVGQSMRKHREHAKVSLRELARRLGCSAPFLSDMELGRRKYSIEWCRKTFALLNAKRMARPETTQPTKQL